MPWARATVGRALAAERVAASRVLFWPCGEHYRCMLGYSGDHSEPSDSELVALARTRPATAAEIEQFEEM